MYKEIVDKIKPELSKIIDSLETQLAKIRTGRASTSLIEDLIVDCFGQKMPLKHLGNITLSGPRQIVIQPWDKSYIEAIEKAIFQSNIGLTPIVDKEVVRINLPPLTEEFRKKMLHLLAEKQEEARQSVRHWREKIWKEIQESFKQKEISEDDKFRAKDELQEIIDEYNEKIEQMGENKRKQIEG